MSDVKPRYSSGQHVTVSDRRDVGPHWSGGFRVTQVLPQGGAAPRYRVTSTGETISRLADEHQLSAAFTLVR